MTRTTRAVPYKHYWGSTKAEAKRDWDNYVPSRWGWKEEYYKRRYLLHGTDGYFYTYPTHEYFNFANRVGRRVARDQLRPHIVLGEDYDYDDSRAVRKYKGVWWDIY